MKKLIFLIILLMIPFSSDAFKSSGFRCKSGGKLIELGEKKFTVLRNCGEPAHKELIGYTVVGKSQTREFKIEEWVYGPRNKRYYHLIFTGNFLSEILSEKK